MFRIVKLVVLLFAASALEACLGSSSTSPDEGGPPVTGSEYTIPPYNVLRHGFDLKGVWANELGSITVGEMGMAFVTIAEGRFMLPLSSSNTFTAVSVAAPGIVFIGTEPGVVSARVYWLQNGRANFRATSSVTALSGVHPMGELPMYESHGAQIAWYTGTNWFASRPSGPNDITDICSPSAGSVWLSFYGGLGYYSASGDSYEYFVQDGNWYDGISSLSITSALAVGGPVGARRIWEFDGQDTFVPVYNSPERLYDICWIEPEFAMAVGEDGATVEKDGDNWIPRHVDPPVDLMAVWPWMEGSARHAIAVGDSGGVYTFAEGQWTGGHSPKITCTELMGVSSDLMFALHEGRLMKYDGEWHELPQAGALDLHDFCCVSEDNVWAVGKSDIDTYAAHWNGTNWQTQWFSSMENANDVWVAETGQVFVACDYGTVYSSQGYWAPMSVIQPVQHLRGIWGASASSVYVVGDKGTISHWDGSVWTPMESSIDVDLISIWGSGDDNVVAGAEDGSVLRFDGTSWFSLNAQHQSEITMIWCDGPTNIWVNDIFGQVEHYDGTGWKSRDPRLDPGRITGIWGQGENFFILAENDLLLKYQVPPSSMVQGLLQ